MPYAALPGTTRRSSDVWVPAVLIALVLIPITAGSLRLVEVFGGPHQLPANPRIAASPAGDYLAVWADQNDDIRGRFIAPAGVPGAEVLIANGGGPKSNPDVAFAGSDFVVVWQRDASGTQQIRAVRVSPTGTVGGAVDVSSRPSSSRR